MCEEENREGQVITSTRRNDNDVYNKERDKAGNENQSRAHMHREKETAGTATPPCDQT